MRRIVADNPGPFTFKGTLSYIVGRGKVAIIDPGPDDPDHVAAVLDAVRGETVTHIFVTHTHRDHSPATPAIKAATGATVYAEGPHRASRPLNAGEAPRMEASNDTDFRPDHALADGDVVSGDGWSLEAVDHARPHREPHGVRAEGRGPDVLRRPRDGLVDHDRGAAGRRDERLHGLAATSSRSAHGDDLPAGPWRRDPRGAALRRRATSCIARRARPRSCTASPRARPTSRRSCARSISGSIRGSSSAAGFSVLAHMEDLVARGAVATDGPPSINGVYRLAGS